MPLRTVPIRRVANRDNLILGGDRELVLSSALIATVLIFVAQAVYTVVLGIGLWLFSLAVLRRMAKSDPQMRFVYLRSRLYAAYYAARSTPFRRDPDARWSRLQ
jgi:type IV secretion system protein VirB3|nr:conjugal transfer protein TrbD [uncultured Ralstonia sp.]